jgi:hypothetical protein
MELLKTYIPIVCEAPYMISVAEQEQERYDEFAELLKLREEIEKLLNVI